MNRSRAFPALVACFFFSGLAALVYQTAWTRQLAFVFGTSELAVATVLGAYMAGLAVGAAAAGRLAPRVTNPVRTYGWLELGIAVSALAVPVGMKAATALLLAVFGGAPGLPSAAHGGVGFFYAATAFLLLMVPTAFMGATLPILVRYAVHTDDELGTRVGTLYAWNTAGAVAGTLLTAFLLLPTLGLGRTVWVAVALNALVFGVVATLGRDPAVAPRAASSVVSDAGTAPGAWILPVIALSGVVSFTGEVLWTRLLSHLLGGSVYAFATMLSSVLLGIALGSRSAARFADTAPRAGRAFAAVQVGAACFSALAFVAVDRLPAVVPAGALAWESLLQGAGLCAVLLLPASLCFGATYPLAVRILAATAEEAGPASARVYAWNTGGAIAGAFGAAFLFLPGLGFDGTLAASVALSGALAVFVAGRTRGAARVPLPAALAIAAAAAILVSGPPLRLLQHGPLGSPAPDGELTWFAVGRSASVTVSRTSGRFDLRTNGLPESKVRTPAAPAGQLLTAHWMSTLPSVFRPTTRDLVVVGLGGGVVAEGVPSGVERVLVVELEPEVVAANRMMAPLRAADPLADPRVQIVENDARSALLLSRERFDAIVAQASHPWTAGSAHLYTREFFELAASRLAPGGVFVQWMGAAFVDADLLRTLVATLNETWPYVRVYRPYAANFLFVASDQPFPGDEAVSAFLASDPAAARRAGLIHPDDLAAALYLDADASRAFGKGARIATDDRNWLQMRSPFVRGSRESVAARGAPDVPGAAERVSMAHVRALIERAGPAAAKVFVRRVAPGDRPLANAMRGFAGGRRTAARSLLGPILEAHPQSRDARALALQVAALAPELGPAPALAPPLRPAERALVDALTARRAGDDAALIALLPRLGAVSWSDPVHRAATALRLDAGLAAARRAAGPEARAARERELIQWIDEALPVYRGDPDLLLRRARLGRDLGDAELVMSTLETFFQPGGASREASPRMVLRLRNVLAGMAMPASYQPRRAALARAMTRAMN